MNGNIILSDLLKNSEFGSKDQAIASLTYFSNPETIKILNNKNVFSIVRNMSKRGEIDEEMKCMYDDNLSVQDLFCWANSIKKTEMVDVQFNHIYSDPNSVSKYTCLSNIVVTPSFLAKLTDTDKAVIQLLKYRAFDIYGYAPDGAIAKPLNYSKIIWRDLLPKQPDLERRLTEKLRKNKKNRIVRSVEKFGWTFNEFKPMKFLSL